MEETAQAHPNLDRLLLELASVTQPLTDPIEIMVAAARLLAVHLQVDRCAFAEVEDQSVYVITGDYSLGVPSIVGRWPVASFGQVHHQMMLANEPYVVDDTESDPRITKSDLAAYRATQIGAVICVPLHKDGIFTAAMAVHQKTSRRWTRAEIDLVTSIVGRCWETLERARVTRNLRNSEERFRALVTASSDIVYCMGPDWKEMRFLQGREFIADTTLPSRTWLDRYIHPDDQEAVILVSRQATASKQPFELEHRVRRVDGSYGWVFSRAIPILDDHGDIVEWFGAASDITTRRQAVESLRESERRYRTLFDAMDEGYCIIEVLFDDQRRPVDYRFVEVNSSFERQAGMNSVVGRRMLEFVPSIETHWLNNYGAVAQTGRAVRFDGEYKGLNRWFDVYAFRADGWPENHVAVLFSDITRRRLAEQELKDADSRKDEFLATLAHELRNPLAPIRNALNLLQLAGGATDDTEKLYEVMDRQVSHMVRLVDDLMEVSRITRGKIEFRPARIELVTVVHSAVESSRPLIEAARHQLTISLPSEPLVLLADAVRLAQVITNLLNNAAKYTRDGGQIWLTAHRDGDFAVVSVRDNGVGIPVDMLTKVFGLFTQADRTYERAQGGLGIGLTLVRRLVEMHGGAVDARSEGPGRGSEFVVRLPLAPPEVSNIERTSGPDRKTTLSPMKILVADDNRDAANSLALLLKFLGAEVHTVNDGIAALEALRTCQPSVALLDIGMPGMDGYEVARRARERIEDPHVVLIALTGWGQDDDRRRSKEAGFDHHLVKPIDVRELQALLSSVPNRRAIHSG